MSRDSSVDIVTRLWAERTRNWGSIPGRDTIFSLFFSSTNPALGPTQHLIGGSFFSAAKRLNREADYSLPCNAEVKNTWNYVLLPHTFVWCGA
jgi:hypothetical protein